MITRPPLLTTIPRLLVRCMDAAAGLSRGMATGLSIGLFAGVTLLDYGLGAGYSVTFLYLFACVFAVWCLGGRAGFAIASFGALGAAAVSHAELPVLMGHQPSLAREAWNLAARLLSFALLAVVVDGLHRALRLEQWEATHDKLTGALNMAGFERAFADSTRRARARGDNLVMAYMDLDGFKQVNDQHGHAAGDHVLRSFAAAAVGAIRPNDLFARVGGDEFAAVLAVPSHVDGHRVAELLHLRLSDILAGSGFEVTCSMGAVFIGSTDAPVDQGIVEQADALMYEVKRTGKNAFRVARGGTINKVLRSAFPPLEGDELDGLLRRIDLAERRERWHSRRAA